MIYIKYLTNCDAMCGGVRLFLFPQLSYPLGKMVPGLSPRFKLFNFYNFGIRKMVTMDE